MHVSQNLFIENKHEFERLLCHVNIVQKFGKISIIGFAASTHPTEYYLVTNSIKYSESS